MGLTRVENTENSEQDDHHQRLLEAGKVIPAASDGLYRVVETGYLGTPDQIDTYVTALQNGKQIEAGTYPAWKHDADDLPELRALPHPSKSVDDCHYMKTAPADHPFWDTERGRELAYQLKREGRDPPVSVL